MFKRTSKHIMKWLNILFRCTFALFNIKQIVLGNCTIKAGHTRSDSATFSRFSSFCWPYRASNKYLTGPIGPDNDLLLLAGNVAETLRVCPALPSRPAPRPRPPQHQPTVSDEQKHTHTHRHILCSMKATKMHWNHSTSLIVIQIR